MLLRKMLGIGLFAFGVASLAQGGGEKRKQSDAFGQTDAQKLEILKKAVYNNRTVKFNYTYLHDFAPKEYLVSIVADENASMESFVSVNEYTDNVEVFCEEIVLDMISQEIEERPEQQTISRKFVLKNMQNVRLH